MTSVLVCYAQQLQDIVFLVILALLVGVTLLISGLAYKHGNPAVFKVVGQPWDWMGYSFAQLYEKFVPWKIIC